MDMTTEHGLIDVTNMSLRELFKLEGDALDHAIGRASAAVAEEPSSQISTFNSAI